METAANRQLPAIALLLQRRKFRQALDKLGALDETKLSEEERAYFYLYKSEAKIYISEYDVEEMIDHAMNYFKKIDNVERAAYARHLLGWLLYYRGEFHEAQECFLEVYSDYKRINNLQGMSRVLNRLAYIYFHTGAIVTAVDCLEKSAEISKKLGEREVLPAHLTNIGTVYFLSGFLKKAVRQYKSLRDRVEEQSDDRRHHFYLTYGMATALQGDIESALKLINETKRLSDDFKRERANYYEYLGWIYNLAGRYKDAEKVLKTGIEYAEKIAPGSGIVSRSKRHLADSYMGLGRIDLAEKYAREALTGAKKIDERAEFAGCYRILAQVELNKGNKDKARRLFKDAMDVYFMVSSRYELAATRYLAASSNLYSNGERSAMLYLAREYFESEGIEHYIKKINNELAKLSAPVIHSNLPEQDFPVFIAAHPKTKKIVELAENIARSDLTVFLTGPTGCGKDQLARYIHLCSGREGQFVVVNAAAIPDTIVESELFGYFRGAFTGADQDRAGLFEEADGGTFYLSEIADTTSQFQAKLLEVIETKTVRRLGGNKKISIDLRIIASTNHDLEQRMRAGRFRPDLYHRLNQIPIAIPSLSERTDDIPALMNHFLAQCGGDLEGSDRGGAFEQLASLFSKQSWPGNVRQLKTEIDRLYLLSSGDMARMLDLAIKGRLTDREILIETLEKTKWNRREAARQLGVAEGTVRYRIKKYGLSPYAGA